MKKIIVVLLAVLFIAGIAQATNYDFTIGVPTTNDNGSPLKDLAGYSLYEDNVKVKDCGNNVICGWDVPEGSHSYTARAYDTLGNESTDSPSKTFDITVCPSPPPTLDAVKATE